MIKNIFVGKAEWGFFVDAQCDKEHNGQSCSCNNISIVETQEEALKIGFKASIKNDVPMYTDWDEDESTLPCDIYVVEDYMDLLQMDNVLDNNPIDQIYIRDVFDDSLYAFLESKYGFDKINESEDNLASIYKKYKNSNKTSCDGMFYSKIHTYTIPV